jgi:hypothetical protein
MYHPVNKWTAHEMDLCDLCVLLAGWGLGLLVALAKGSTSSQHSQHFEPVGGQPIQQAV